MEIPKYYGSMFEGSFVRYYDFFMELIMFGRGKKIRSKVFQFFPEKRKKILEIACGTGSNLVLIKNKYKNSEVYGVDLSEKMLGVAKTKNKDLKLSRQNMEKTNFKDNYFDVVLISLSLHEVPLEVRGKVIKEAYRILKKDGRFIIFDGDLPKNFILRIIFKVFIKFFEDYADSFIKQDLVEELNKNKFKNCRKNSYYNNLIQIVYGDK